ncbi:MAG: glycoside hydrolase family 38 C-terminal domain-containing protein [Gemmatimonadales bacterium]
MTAFIFHIIAHTHWDREWFLPRAAFHARLIAMCDELVERLQADVTFRTFLLDGQTVLVEDYLRARPERENDVKALVKTGRLQVGPWYVLADELIPSGESLIRNLLLGAADAERWGGRLDVLYSPDAFGHSGALPTLAREFGIKFGVLWRGLGGAPRGGAGQEGDFFRWRGTDGREILLWHLPPEGYEIGAALAGAGARLPDLWTQVRATLVQRAAGKHIPLFVGADHHAPHPTLGRLRDLLADLEPASAFRVSRLDEFFQAAEGSPARPVAGELRWSYGYTWTLQGVHGTRAPLKRRHGQIELWLERIAEPLVALTRLAAAGNRDRRPVLDAAWRALVRTQFHDTIAGCTADSVAAAAEQRLAEVAAYAAELTRSGLHELAGYDPDLSRERAEGSAPALVLWNPAARPRGGVTVADVTMFRRDVLVGPPPPADGRMTRQGPGYRPFALYGSDGRALPVQVLAQRVTHERNDATRHYPDQDEVDQVRIAFRAPSLPGLGVDALKAGGAAPLSRADDVRVRGRALENRFLQVAVEPNGSLTITDRRKNERYVELLCLEDGGDAGDAYTYCPPVRDRVKVSPPHGPIAVRRLAGGPLVAALEARWEVTRGIAARMVVQLYADSSLVRVTLDIDNRNAYHRLRARLPTGLAGAPALAGAAFAAVERMSVTADPAAYPRETPVRTAPAHRFVAATRGGRGLAVLAPGFFEYEWTTKGELLVTLLRAIGDLSRGDLPTRPGHAGWPMAIPAAQCIGTTRIDLALVPVTAADLERGDVVPQHWEDAFLPLHGLWLRDAATLAPAPVNIALEGSGLVFSALKPAQIGSPMVLRCYNPTARKVAGAWRFANGVKTAHRVRADEREAVALVLEQRGNVVRFVAEPHEIVSILVT